MICIPKAKIIGIMKLIWKEKSRDISIFISKFTICWSSMLVIGGKIQKILALPMIDPIRGGVKNSI